jgi:hypothetical protein
MVIAIITAFTAVRMVVDTVARDIHRAFVHAVLERWLSILEDDLRSMPHGAIHVECLLPLGSTYSQVAVKMLTSFGFEKIFLEDSFHINANNPNSNSVDLARPPSWNS